MFRRIASATAAALLISTAVPATAFTPRSSQTAPAQPPGPPASQAAPPAAAAKIPVPPGALAIENVAFKGALFEVSIPQIVVEGSANTKADIEALFDPRSSTPLSERLGKISADRISIPAIIITQTSKETKQVTTYQGSVLRNIRSGVIADFTIGSTVAKGEASKVKFEMTSGAMVLKGTDAPLLARYILEKGSPNEPLKVAMAEQVVGKIDYKIDGVGSFTVAGGRMDNLKVRPVSMPMLDTFARFEGGAKSEAEKKELAKFFSELATSVSFSNFELNGMAGEGKDAKGQTNRFALDKMAMAGGADVSGRFSLLGMRFDSPEAKFGIRDITLDGISASSALAALGKAIDAGTTDIEDPLVLLPKIDLIRFAGIVASVTERGKEPISFSLGNLEFKMGNHIGSIPANNAMVLDKLQMDIPPTTKEEGLKTLLRMGYKGLDLSARYTQTWDEATKILKVSDFVVSAANMFSARMDAEVADVSKELFSGDKAKSAVALLGVNAKSLALNVVNSGIFEKAIEEQARQQKMKPEDLRAQLAAGSALMIPMFMGNHPSAKVLADAVGKFLASPKNLSIAATAQGGGIGAADFLASGNPMDLLKKIDFKASANQ